MKWLRSIPVRYPKITLAAGIILLILAGVYGLGIFPKLTSNDNSFNAIGTESDQVDTQVKRDFDSGTNSSYILFEPKDNSLRVTDPTYASEVGRLLANLGPKTQATYYDTGAPSMLSHDGTKTYAVVTMDGDSTAQATKLINFMDNTKSDKLTVKVGGTIIGEQQAIEQTRHDLELAELISLPIVAVLLLIFFRSVAAAAVPLVMAFLTICGALAVAHIIQQFTKIDTYTINIITILGLGLSVDYSLLAVNRFREELARGLHRDEAARITSRTAGRTIMFSAFTVIICILSLLIFPVGFMHSIAIGGASAVLVAMLVSLALIPALFALLGHNIDRWKLPLPTSKRPDSIWRHVAAFGVKRPIMTLLAGTIVVGAFAWPLLHVKSAEFDYRALPNNSSAYAVGKTLANEFEAKAPSITVLATYDHTPSVKDMCQTASILQSLKSVSSIMAPYTPANGATCDQLAQDDTYHMLPPELTAVSTPRIHENVTKIDITPSGSATDQSTIDLIRALRSRHDTGIMYQVGGMAALSEDALRSYAKYAPYAILIIAITMLIVLTLSLGSVVIPLQSIIINSLGLLIAIGSLVILYQFGWLSSLIHQTVFTGLNPSMPILICVIAFGLSMDYAVFLYSRMHEVYEKTGDANRAILEGVEKTGPIITAAALVFFAVVAAFTLSKISMMQQIGFGLAVAVMVDAFVIRILFVPAVMRLFGKASWYAPSWIKRLVIRHE